MAEKGVQLNATVPRDWDTKLEDHRWTVRKTKTQLVKSYIERGMIQDGLLPASDADNGTEPLEGDENGQH